MYTKFVMNCFFQPSVFKHPALICFAMLLIYQSSLPILNNPIVRYRPQLYYNTLQDDCVICISRLGTQIRWLPCGHAFHDQCIQVWFAQAKWCCPTCRRHHQMG